MGKGSMKNNKKSGLNFNNKKYIFAVIDNKFADDLRSLNPKDVLENSKNGGNTRRPMIILEDDVILVSNDNIKCRGCIPFHSTDDDNIHPALIKLDSSERLKNSLNIGKKIYVPEELLTEINGRSSEISDHYKFRNSIRKINQYNDDGKDIVDVIKDYTNKVDNKIDNFDKNSTSRESNINGIKSYAKRKNK